MKESVNANIVCDGSAYYSALSADLEKLPEMRKNNMYRCANVTSVVSAVDSTRMV